MTPEIDLPNQLISTFRVGEARYGLDAGKIQEVIRYDRFTAVPHAPGCVVGLINLRGKIVTLIDLSRKLGGPGIVSADRRALIVEHNNELAGLVVDGVYDVVDVPGSDISPVAPPEACDAAYFAGVCRSGGVLVTLLHAPAVLAPAGLDARAASR